MRKNVLVGALTVLINCSPFAQFYSQVWTQKMYWELSYI